MNRHCQETSRWPAPQIAPVLPVPCHTRASRQRAGGDRRQPTCQRAGRRRAPRLAAAIEAAQADATVAAVLIVGAGRNFIAGADIREFGKPPQPPCAARRVQPHRGQQPSR
jgi:hypothetical protein